MVMILKSKALSLKFLLNSLFVTFFLFVNSQEKFNTYYQNSGKLKAVFYGFVNNGDTVKNGDYKSIMKMILYGRLANLMMVCFLDFGEIITQMEK